MGNFTSWGMTSRL